MKALNLHYCVLSLYAVYQTDSVHSYTLPIGDCINTTVKSMKCSSFLALVSSVVESNHQLLLRELSKDTGVDEI